jgi:diaminopimelate decarboxylase
MPRSKQPWWSRPGLEVVDGRLHVAGRDAEALARDHGTPLFVYDLERTGEQARALRDAFARRGAPFTLRLALKAQRDPAVLAFVRDLGFVGVDACSPGEVLHALTYGWRPDEISYTGTNVSERDLDALLEHGVPVNVDLLSQLERFGRRAPGARVGLRVNPRAGATWSGATWTSGGESIYASAKPTKFGIYEEQLDDALRIAKQHDLSIDTVHVHVGDGFLTDGLPQFEVVVDRVAGFVRRLVDAGHEIQEVNAGGGIGVPQRSEDRPLDVDAYAGVLVDRLKGFGVTIAAEPGDFLVKECGVLLGEVVSVEDRDGVRFVGLDTGYNVAPERFIYGALVPIVLCRAAEAEPVGTVTVGGNINEGDDLWGEDVSLPEVREGDVLGMLLVGSYNQSMHLDHCLRPPSGVLAFADREPR